MFEPSEDYPLGGSIEPYDIKTEVELLDDELEDWAEETSDDIDSVILGESGLVGRCDCGNAVYQHMEENVAIFEVTGLCGVCATGEADCYFDEL